MSQAKVDKRKYEKQHRKEIEKKRKVKFAVTCIVAALLVGAVIGIPTGISIYKSIPKYVGDSSLESFVSTYIDDNHAEDVSVLKDDTNTDTTEVESDAEKAVEDATGLELETVDEDDLTEE